MTDPVNNPAHYCGHPNEYRRRALRKILDATPETWEALCYLSLCTAGTFALKTAEQALLEHIGAQL